MSIAEPCHASSDAAAIFLRHFGHPPAWIASAPGRVNLMGEHVDYNDGFVLPAALERRTSIALRPVSGRLLTVRTALAPEAVTLDISTVPVPGKPSWANYLRGVLAGFLERGIDLQGAEMFITSDVPHGGGLSSSAALEVSFAGALEGLSGHRLAAKDKALLCQKAEQEFAGVPCGVMDQYVSVHAQAGHALLLDCRSLTHEDIPFDDPNVSILIIDTKVKHELTGGEYARRRADCEQAARLMSVASLRDVSPENFSAQELKLPDIPRRRARHVITETARTLAMAEAIRRHDWGAAGEIMHASHDSLRDDFQVSCPELDCVVATAADTPGIYGCRMTGGGFGGCAVALVESARRPEIVERLGAACHQRSGITPVMFATRPGGGSRVEESR